MTEHHQLLSFETLRAAVTGHAAAFRLRLRLEPAGGPGTKVFPPTHEGGQYAWETRRIDGREVSTVLLNSVQSEANHMELALLEACRAGRLALPMLETDFSMFPDIGSVTTFEAPHRIADAIFRDSTLDGVEFRKTPLGQAFAEATIRNANALLRACPNALVFGVWDSTGSAGGLGNKFQRAVVAEIAGIDAVPGVLAASRIDPLGIKRVDIYRTADGDWTTEKPSDPKAAAVKPSEINHSNIPPSFAVAEKDGLSAKRGDAIRGGVTLDHAELTVVVSLPALRKLCFPKNGKRGPERDAAARTLLAALALTGVALRVAQGFALRSRCDLVPTARPVYECIGAYGDATPFALDAEQALAILEQAVQAARAAGLEWPTEPVRLQPLPKLVELVRKSRAAAHVEE